MISIIIPCYNAERFLSEIINDVLNQQYQDWELLIVSNGKKQEKQLKIANDFVMRDNRVKVIHTESGGVSHARNLGLLQARGEWACFVDADDELKSNHLQLYVDADDSISDMIVGGFSQIDITGKESKHLYVDETVNLESALGTTLYKATSDKMGNAPWHTLYKTEFLRRNHISFDTRFSMNEDRIFNQTAFLSAKQIKFIPMTGYVYHASEGSAMSRWHQNVEESWNVFLDIKDEVKRKSGIEPDKIYQDRCNMRCFLVWQYLWNIFKAGSPFSSRQKYNHIVEYLKDDVFWRSCRMHDWSNDNIFLRLFHVCVMTHSPLLVFLLFYSQHKVKKIINVMKK